MFVGIDLSTASASTGVACVRVDGTQLTLERLGTHTSLFAGKDSDLIALIDRAQVAAIDAPFGWPDAFRSFIATQDHPSPLTVSVRPQTVNVAARSNSEPDHQTPADPHSHDNGDADFSAHLQAVTTAEEAGVDQITDQDSIQGPYAG